MDRNQISYNNYMSKHRLTNANVCGCGFKEVATSGDIQKYAEHIEDVNRKYFKALEMRDGTIKTFDGDYEGPNQRVLLPAICANRENARELFNESLFANCQVTLDFSDADMISDGFLNELVKISELQNLVFVVVNYEGGISEDMKLLLET